MSHSDLSDQALAAFINLEKKKHQDLVYPNYQSSELQAYLNGIDFAWQECRRRAYEEIKQAHRTGYTEGTEMAEAGKEIELEKARREAISFAIGRVLYADGIAPEIEVDETYRAFLQERN